MEETERTQVQLIAKAQKLYQQSRALLQSGDFAGYAGAIEELGKIIEQLATK